MVIINQYVSGQSLCSSCHHFVTFGRIINRCYTRSKIILLSSTTISLHLSITVMVVQLQLLSIWVHLSSKPVCSHLVSVRLFNLRKIVSHSNNYYRHWSITTSPTSVFTIIHFLVSIYSINKKLFSSSSRSSSVSSNC